MRVKIREDAVVRNQAVYLALGVLPDGTRDIAGAVDREYRRRQVLSEGLCYAPLSLVPNSFRNPKFFQEV